MDFDSLGSIISTAAPALGEVVSSLIPGSGLIIKGIASLFGADESNPDDIARKLQQDPQATMKLMQFEKEHAQALLALTLKDKESARSREIEFLKATGKRDWVVSLIGICVIGGFFSLIAMLFFCHPVEKIKDIMEIMLGSVSAGYTMVLSYYFGSMNKRV